VTEKVVEIKGRTLRLLVGNIVTVPVDAMANAANGGLRGGGGVDGAIHTAGGPAIMHELDRIRPNDALLPAGKVVATSAGRLPAKYVFHAVGPIWRGGYYGEPEALAACYRNSLSMAEERGCKSISFPSISTGVYGYPVDRAASVALREVASFLRDRASSVAAVTFVLFDKATYDAYEESLRHSQGE
jgi:O-acetyl-ADP-ribose deacetylase (regulator of RNase III)